MKDNELKIQYVKTKDLVPYAQNAKIHDEAQIEQIAKSMNDYGNNDPIAVWHNANGEMEVVEGHGRLMALNKLGVETVPVIYLDHLTDEQRREYALVHNQTTMNSGFDFAILDGELEGLPDFDAEFYGFDVGGVFDELDLDADQNEEEKTVVRLVFENYKQYSMHEKEIKNFAAEIGAQITIGK